MDIGKATQDLIAQLEAQLAEAKRSRDSFSGMWKRSQLENEELENELAETKKAAEWTRIDAEHLPQVGDEIGGWDTDAEGILYWYLRAVDDDEQVEDDLIAIPDMTAENWAEQIITHYRAKNAPRKESK